MPAKATFSRADIKAVVSFALNYRRGTLINWVRWPELGHRWTVNQARWQWYMLTKRLGTSEVDEVAGRILHDDETHALPASAAAGLNDMVYRPRGWTLDEATRFAKAADKSPLPNGGRKGALEGLSLDEMIRIAGGAQDPLEALTATNRLMRQHTPSLGVDETAVEIPEKVFFLTFLGDFHLENIETDLVKLKRDLEIVRDTPGLYVIVNGDGTENPIKHRGSSFEVVATPEFSRRVYVSLIEIIKDKVLAMALGCHERFAKDLADYDIVADLCERLGVPYLGYGGRVKIRAGGATLVASVSHKGLGSSYLNAFHPCVRQIRERDPDADIVAIAHNHVTAIGIQEEQGKPRVMVRTGAYKTGDRFSRMLGYRRLECHLDRPAVRVDLRGERPRFTIYQDLSQITKE